MFWGSTFTIYTEMGQKEALNPEIYPESDFMLRKSLCPLCGTNRMQEIPVKEFRPCLITFISSGAVAGVNS